MDYNGEWSSFNFISHETVSSLEADITIKEKKEGANAKKHIILIQNN
jgi:hypothetical protein